MANFSSALWHVRIKIKTLRERRQKRTFVIDFVRIPITTQQFAITTPLHETCFFNFRQKKFGNFERTDSIFINLYVG